MYNKRVLSKAKAELNKAKAPKKSQDIITDPMGQWKYPGLPTRIPSNNITMEGVGYPVLGVGNNGQRKIMLPGAEYTFPGADYVDEYPQMKKGGERKRRKTKSLSGTNKLMQQNPLLRNYKNREFDPNVDYFQDGGMKTVKSKDGTVTNKFTNTNGDTVIQVKTKDGKYSEKIIPASTNTNKNTFVKYDKNLDTSLIPSESTYVNNPVVSKLPEFVTKGMINYIKDENKKKQERLIQEVKKDNNNVVEYYKGYHDSPRYKEMLQKSDPENWEDIYDSRNANLEGYDPGSFINYYLPKKSFGREYTDKTRLFISNTQPKDEPNTGGDSNSETGLIRIFPKGYGGKGMLAHEYSHSIDRPAGGSGHYIKPRFDWYENKTPYDPNNRLIPKKDKDWINKHRPIDFYESPEFKKASPAEKKYYLDNRHMYWDRNKEWYDYVGEDTETRARLNDIRYQSKKRGIYDPYTQKVNNKTFKKVLKTKYETGDKEGFDALKQLQDVYSDDEIQWMLNNISKKEDKNTDIPYAQDGGFSLGMYASPEMGNTVEPSLNYNQGNFSANASTNIPVENWRDYSKNLNLSARYAKDLGKYGNIDLSGNASFNEGQQPDYNMSVNYNKQFKNGLGINIKGDSPLKNIRNNGNASVGLTYNFQDGGFKTKLSKEEEKEFQKFYETLPENLQSDDPTYDIRGYWDGSGRPSEFDYSQPKEDDGYYHAFSINPNTGEYLKSPAHPTFMQAVEEDKKMGYKPSFNIRSGRWESEEVSPEYEDGGYIEAELTDDEIEEYRKGGYIIEDISVPELNQAQKGKFIAPSLPIDRTKSETTQMFQPIVKNAIRDKNVVQAREIEERKRNIDRGVKAVKNSIAAIEKNKTYTKKQKTELLKKETDKLFNIDQTQLEETGAVLNQTDQHTIKAAPEKTVGDYAERTWDIITNPLDAAKYSISGGGIENMPWNYNKMKELGIDPSARSYQERFSGSDQKSNMVGDVLNSFNLADAGDKVYRNVSKGNWEDAALEATRFLEVGAFMKPNTLKKIATAIPSNPKQLLRKVEDNRGLNKVVEALTEGSIKLFNPLDNLAQRFVGKTSAEDIKRKISMLNAGSSVRDLKKGEKAFNKIKDESLEFWKTDEGKRRVQKYLDENELTNYGIDFDQYIDMMNDVKYLDDSTVKDTRNVMEAIYSERKKIETKKQKINDEINKLVKDSHKKSPEGRIYMDRSVEDQIDKLTEELDNLTNIDYSHIESLNNLPSVPTNNAYYSPLNSAGDNSKVFIGEDFLSDAALDQTAYHEWGHAKHLQPHMILAKYFPGYTNQFADSGELSKTRPLNKRLREGLDMESDDYFLDKDKLPMHLQNEENYNKLYRNASAVSSTGKSRYANPEAYWLGERKYFDHNDEANTFLQELIPELKKRGYIQKFGDHIEPQMIADLFNEYRTEASKKIIEPVRLLDIVKPTGKSIHRITEELNNLHTLLIGAGGAGAAGATLSDDEESEPVYEKGGIVTELSEDEIQDYINQGYVVEEVDSPKMQTGGQLPYQVWQEKTGTSWAEAKRQGLTDGSASGNIALMNKLLAGETPTVGSNNTPRATTVQSNSGYDAYDRNVKQMVSNGASLEDLVNIRMGTKEGLVNRFPDLFSASNAKSKEVNKINIPQNKKTIATKVDAIVNKPDTQSVKSIVPQLKNIPAESTITRIPAPKVVAPIVKKFEKSKVKVEQKLQQKDTEDMVNRIREQLTPDSLKKQQLIKSDVISYKPQIQPKPQIKKQIPPITKQDTFKPIITDTNKGPEIIKPVQIKSPIDVKKPLAVKTPQQIIDTQNYLKPVVKFKKGSKLTEQKPEEESKIVKEDADYKVINNLTQRLNKFDESLQGLYYDYTNPHNTSEKRKQATQTFKNKIAERNNLINTINSKKRDYAGGIDSWVDESAPAWIKKPAQKWDLSDQVETTSYKLPTLQTYKEKEEQDNEKFRTTKRFDDLGGTEKGSRWQFRVSASNDDPMKVQLYGTRAERNPNLNIKSKGAVMHFLDQSPLTGYVHPTTKAYYRDLKQDAYVGKLEKLQDGTYGVKYVPKKDIPAKDLTKNTFLVRQEKFDNIDFNKKVGDDNFSGHTYWTKKGTERATIPVSSGKDANVYDYSSGQSVVFIFPYKGKTRYVHYAGSPNAIKKEGEEIKKLYKLQANKLVLGVADAGSYSSSVKGNITDKKLKDWNYGYANRNSFTGAGMALVD